ncbi:MAG: hypothetical protein R3B06_00785 [Kofleriaceae bacterium]
MNRELPASVPPPPIAATSPRARGTVPPMCKADLSITCPTCATLMEPEHAHYKCPRCGYRDSCCF